MHKFNDFLFNRIKKEKETGGGIHRYPDNYYYRCGGSTGFSGGCSLFYGRFLPEKGGGKRDWKRGGRGKKNYQRRFEIM